MVLWRRRPGLWRVASKRYAFASRGSRNTQYNWLSAKAKFGPFQVDRNILRYIFENFDLQYNANAKQIAKGINKGYVLQERPFDFALCAVGNSTSDKELLDYIDLLKAATRTATTVPLILPRHFQRRLQNVLLQSSQSGYFLATMFLKMLRIFANCFEI